MAMNVLIVEDEIMAQKSLTRMLAQHFPDFTVVGTTSSVKGTVAWLENPENKADIIFMDVELSDGVCFEIFRQTEVKSRVIMTTAYDNYALKAFEAGSIDYLLKPIDSSALKRAVARCRMSGGHIDVDSLLKSVNSNTSAVKDFKERYIVRFNDRIVPLLISNVAYIYSEEKNNYLVTFDEERYIVDSSLDIVMEDLNPEEFFRISRSCIISMKAIRSIVKQPGGRLRVCSEPQASFEMTVSRSRVDDFLTWIEK